MRAQRGTSTGNLPVDVPACAAKARRLGGAGAAALLALVLASGCGGEGSSPSAPALVRVVAGDGPAREVSTGWVSGNGRVVTVAHALRGGGGVLVDGRAARVVARSERLDVAVLSVPGVRADAWRVEGARPGQHASVWVLRDGRAHRLDATVRRTITARVHDQPGDVPQVRPGIELDAPIVSGDSGAPVVDARGRLLGVAFARSAHAAYAVAARVVLPAAR